MWVICVLRFLCGCFCGFAVVRRALGLRLCQQACACACVNLPLFFTAAAVAAVVVAAPAAPAATPFAADIAAVTQAAIAAAAAAVAKIVYLLETRPTERVSYPLKFDTCCFFISLFRLILVPPVHFSREPVHVFCLFPPVFPKKKFTLCFLCS